MCFLLVVWVSYICADIVCFFFFKQKTAYEMRISDWSSDVCSSDLGGVRGRRRNRRRADPGGDGAAGGDPPRIRPDEGGRGCGGEGGVRRKGARDRLSGWDDDRIAARRADGGRDCEVGRIFQLWHQRPDPDDDRQARRSTRLNYSH